MLRFAVFLYEYLHLFLTYLKKNLQLLLFTPYTVLEIQFPHTVILFVQRSIIAFI